MNVKINSSLSALGNLLAAIVDANPAFAVITEAQLGVVSVAGVTADAEGRDTVVVVNAEGYADTQSFTYARRALGDNVVAPVPTSLQLTGSEKAEDVLNAVAKLLNLVPSELVLNASWINTDGSITVPTPAADGSVTTGLSVTAKTASLLYVDGAAASLTINFPSVPAAPTPSITSLVTNSALSGFAPAEAPAQPAAPTDNSGTTTQPASTDTPAAPAADGQAAAGTTDAPAATDTPAAPTGDATPVAEPAVEQPSAPAAPADQPAAGQPDAAPASSN
jgi:hypothetical protein